MDNKSFLQAIEDNQIKERILLHSFDDIICYPGCGLDITPCLLHCSDRSYNFMVNTSKNPLFVFCDPCFNYQYAGFWDFLCSEIQSEESITSDSVLDVLKNNWYPDGITAWANPFYVGFIKTSTIHNPISGKEDSILYTELLLDDQKFRIITFPYTDIDMWDFLSYFELKANGVFLWDEDKFNFYYDVINKEVFDNPEWILMNRASKYALFSLYDEVVLNSKEIEAINMVRYPEKLRKADFEIDDDIRLYTLHRYA